MFVRTPYKKYAVEDYFRPSVGTVPVKMNKEYHDVKYKGRFNQSNSK